MADALRIKFDDKAAQGWLDDILETTQEAVRPAAQAGSQVLYDEVVLRAPEGRVDQHMFHIRGKVYGPFEKGNLKRSIYQVFSEDNSAQAGPGYQKATYHISWNRLKAPYGSMVENGTSRAAAHPFLRPAYDATKELALDASKAVWLDRIEQVVS